MADDEYAKKMETLQQYIPFLDNMIQQLKDPTKKNREQQLAKMQSLHAMITDKKKKLKLETLIRCEDVISKLYEKVHNRPIGAPKKSVSSPPLLLTPASPSPTRNMANPTSPLTIPIERLGDDRQKVKIDIYSSAAESLNRPKVYGMTVSAKVPDMSKPPISLEDLKTLEDDVQDKINESSLQTASLSQLNNLREMISEQIQEEEKKTNSPQKPKREDDINTTARNNLSLTKLAIQSPEKPKIKERNTESPKSVTSLKSKDLKSESDSENKKDVKVPIQLNVKPKSPKILKEPASIFGSILSNIDDQILGGQKKKEERRNSIPGKEERRLSDASKEKSSKSHDKPAKKEERKHSSGKQEKRSDDKKKSEKTGSSEKGKESSKEQKNKEAYFSLSGKQSLEEKELQLKEKLLSRHAERLKNEISLIDGQKDSKEKIEEDNSKETGITKDETIVSRISVKKDLELKPSPVEKKEEVPIEIKEDASKTPVYKRLADKYNPKPRKQSLDNDIDKSISDRIEENMKISPPKIPQINKMPEPVPPPPSLVLCSQSEPELPSQPTSQLPAVLQNILNPNTTQLINTVVSQLRKSSAEKEARNSPLSTNTQVPLLGNVPSIIGNPSSLLGNPPSLLGNPPSLLATAPSLLGNHSAVTGNGGPLIGNSPSLVGNVNLLSPPVVEDNFVSEYCRDAFNAEDNSFNKQTMPDFSNNRYTPPARPESRMRFDAPQGQDMMGNQLAQQNNRFMPSGVGERFNDVYMPNRQFPTHQPMPDMYSQSFGYNQNHADMQSLDYYPPNAPLPANQYNCGPPLLSPEVPHYHNEQKPGGFGMVMNNDFFGHNEEGSHWRVSNDDHRFHWGDRREQDMRVNRDPRTYREYREMREARDPRVTRDPRESRDSRDPRINRDARERDFRERDFRDPRLNRSRDPRDDRDRDRARSVHRESGPQSRDYRPSRYDSKFDRMYSRTNRERSRSRSRSRPRETFTSPLDSLYSGKDEHKTGKGYGVQNFRIPRIKKEDDTKEKEDEHAKVSSTNEDLVEAVEGDTENNDDVVDTDVEEQQPPDQTEPDVLEEADAKKAETVTTVIEQELSESPAPQEVTEVVKEVLPTQSVPEPEPPKVTSSEPSEPEGKPADQTILAHFFANLLGSKNKRDKKTALYSLISTFSDSFSEKELSKITKIIKADDEDEDSSEEEEEAKKVTPKTDEEKETPKEDASEITEAEDEVTTPKSRPRRRIMRISSNSPSKEDKNELEPAKSPEPPEPEREESGVIVSVGERIKSRRRQTVSPSKPRKKIRTELDMLHEDIQDMFIRDGVLTASGKRMCRILKGDPSVMSAVQESKPVPGEPVKVRKKPGPKPKPKGPNAAEVKVMKSVRVVIPKMPDRSSSQETPRRNLRRSARNVAYAESDDETIVREETPTVDEDSPLEDDDLREMESGAESSDSDKEKSSQPTENQKSKMVKRKRGKSWASGVLPSNRKKKKKQASVDESEETPDNKEADKSVETVHDSDVDKSYVEPDKNYYIDVVTSKSHHCKLCPYQGRFITTHYKSIHPESEILTSRFSPTAAEEAIKDSEKNLEKYESLTRIKGGGKIQFICRFCQFNTSVPPTIFYDHITTHTGEYRHICPICDFSAPSGKTLKSHMLNTHNNDKRRIARKSYSQTVMFGYMCGECNYVQLSKTNVEEHINIFHLQKPTIYKINMSIYLDPEVEKVAQEQQETESGAAEQPSTVEDKPTEETKQAKVAVEKPVEKKMPPPQYKKRGPKPGPRKKKVPEPEKVPADTESDSATDTESVTSRDSLDSRIDNTEQIISVGKRRSTREKSIEEEISPVRSRRAAKDKAAEKLKTLMEATEGFMRRKSYAGDETKKHEEKKRDVAKTKTTEENARDKPTREEINHENNSKNVDKEPPDITNEETPKPETKVDDPMKVVVKKEVELNVFTCKTDLQEENKKIEQERLQLMDELNKSMGSRTSLNFVDKLCNRLNQGSVSVKEEPRDGPSYGLFNMDTGNKSPLVMPVLHKEKLLITPTSSAVPSTSAQTVTPNKKPILEPEVTQITKSNFDVVQKNDKVITDMIQKLKGMLGTGVDDTKKKLPSPICVDDNDYDSEGPPPLTHVNELVNIKPTDGSTKTLLIGGFVKVIRSSETLMFSCLVPPCVFSTADKDTFQKHCKDVHKQSSLNRPSTLCELCGTEVVATKEYTLLENLFKHIISDHADFINNEPEPEAPAPLPMKPPNRVLRIRKLSGDALSVPKKDDWDEAIPLAIAVSLTAEGAEEDVEASAATADKEETDKENQNSFDVVTPAISNVESVPTDDQPATMVELNMSEDNPFPFKISGVMSLAEQQPQLPPLAPIALKTGTQLTGSQLIVKEAKLTQAELQKPRKTAKAMAKFISSVSDLYKCPHYYCLFSTNFRDFLERHLRAHKVEHDIMIPCVYCDMKTPWEHVPMHIDIRHAHCRFACSYCLYRAVRKEYVFLHQDQVHPANDYSVIALPQSKHSKKFAIADFKVDPRSLCEPYRCTKACNAEFLYENEFKSHLLEMHKTSFIPCGYQDCLNRVQTTKMASHWSLMHGVCVYQCGVCRNGSNELLKMYHHFSQCHPGLQPNILIRILTPMQEGKYLGYTAEALKMMRKVVTLPSNIIDHSKTVGTKALEAMILPTSIQCGSQANYQLPTSGSTVKMVTPLTQAVQKSVLIPTAKPVMNRIAFVGAASPNPGTSNILLLPTSSVGTIVVTAQSPLVTSVAPSGEATVKVVPSVEPVPSISAVEGTITPPLPEERDSNVEASPVDANQDAQVAIAPLEHITLGDDGQLAVDDGDNGDIDPLSLDADFMDASKNDGDSSGDESDGSKVDKAKKQSKTGLLSYQLYRCAFCDISFSNSNDFKKHASKSLSCRRPEGTVKQFVCVHCDRKLRNAHVLVDHIQCHGVWRFSCSLCSNKYPTANQARSHVKTRHNISQTVLTPVNPSKSNPDTDEYVVRPKLALQPGGESTPSEISPGASSGENVYTPDQIEKIPMRHILSASIKCGLCSYNTKVRTNMVRHLQFHLEEKAVSESAPVNPVPCLEKNEKMFDKMVNLASSSHATSRMGGAKADGKEKEADNLPEFVSTHCRYVCPAQGCNYLCPEEANLRHHIMALHDSETAFTCLHCRADLSQMEPDHLIKHFKLHGRQLFRCQHCNFVHHFKHKVEKHAQDVHLDLPVKVITVRCLESEPVDPEPSTSGTQSTPSAPPSKVKPWRCCMCKYKSGTQDGIQQHVLEKHEIDSQFKCALCTYKNNDQESFTEHFKEAHDNQSADIIYTYRKVEDKEKENEAFDTTPLWQRDRPRVRHIRGILFDESTPVVTKSPKKVPKAIPAASPGPSGVRMISSSPGPSTSKNANLDFSIESVANGTATILHDKPSTTIADEFVELVNKYAKEAGDYLDEAAAKEKEDDDVIVIEDDDDKDVPLAKNKDNKDAPVAKNRPSKRKAAPEVVAPAKVAKVSEEVIDLDSAGNVEDDQDEFSERNLKVRFAGFGTPVNRQLKCPVCNKFKSKRISDFIFHMYKEMKVYRFKCKLCADESITFRYMYKHVQDHNDSRGCDDNIIFLSPNRHLEAWLQMVIREQSLTILQNFLPTPDDNLPSDKKSVECPHCDRKYLTEQERNEHSIVHWSPKPYACKKCKFTTYNYKEVERHVEVVHRYVLKIEQHVAYRAPTIAKELKASDRAHMREVNSIYAEESGDENNEEDDPLRLPTEEESLRESDLVIVTKTDSNVPNENDVFCCEYCPVMADSEALVLSHITSVHEHMHIKFKTLNKVTSDLAMRDFVGCVHCDEIGSEIRIRQHHLDNHDGQTFVMYRYTCTVCQHKFAKMNGLKLHFKKVHPNAALRYTGLPTAEGEEPPVQEAPAPAQSTATAPTHKMKSYKCPLCSYQRVFRPKSVNNVRSHVRQHFKAYSCATCPAGAPRFKTRWEAISHSVKEHAGAPEDVLLDPKVNDAFNETMAQIVREARPVGGRNTARKSTSAPAQRVEEEYSFYGTRPEPVDMAKITTAVEINGMTLNMTADKLSNIFDLNARVLVEDCNMSVNLTSLFDS